MTANEIYQSNSIFNTHISVKKCKGFHFIRVVCDKACFLSLTSGVVDNVKWCGILSKYM